METQHWREIPLANENPRAPYPGGCLPTLLARLRKTRVIFHRGWMSVQTRHNRDTLLFVSRS